MKFNQIDNLFIQSKKLVSGLGLLSLILALLFFIYWFIATIGVPLPDFISGFFLMWTGLVGDILKNTENHQDLLKILPLIVSAFFVAMTYIINCCMTYIENSHKKFKKYVADYKANLERTINEELKKSFVGELQKSTMLIARVKIEVKPVTSYLKEPLTEVEAEKLQKTIMKEICNSIQEDYIIVKELENETAYFLCGRLGRAPEFFANFVQNATSFIRKYLTEKATINFFCAVDVLSHENEVNYKLAELDNILSLKVKNMILTAPRFKTYFDELYPGRFNFKLHGEYNFSKTDYKSHFISIYTLHKAGK